MIGTEKPALNFLNDIIYYDFRTRQICGIDEEEKDRKR